MYTHIQLLCIRCKMCKNSNRGLSALLLVDQSTNWLTNCSCGLLIFINQMSILVDELINQMTKK